MSTATEFPLLYPHAVDEVSHSLSIKFGETSCWLTLGDMRELFLKRLRCIRELIANQLGLVFPQATVTYDPTLPSQAFVIAFDEREVSRGALHFERALGIGPEAKLDKMDGKAAKFLGLQAKWFAYPQRAEAEKLGLFPLTELEVFSCIFIQALRASGYLLLCEKQVQRHLEAFAQTRPLLVGRARVHSPPGSLLLLLRSILNSGYSIRDLRLILERFARNNWHQEPTLNSLRCYFEDCRSRRRTSSSLHPQKRKVLLTLSQLLSDQVHLPEDFSAFKRDEMRQLHDLFAKMTSNTPIPHPTLLDLNRGPSRETWSFISPKEERSSEKVEFQSFRLAGLHRTWFALEYPASALDFDHRSIIAWNQAFVEEYGVLPPPILITVRRSGADGVALYIHGQEFSRILETDCESIRKMVWAAYFESVEFGLEEVEEFLQKLGGVNPSLARRLSESLTHELLGDVLGGLLRRRVPLKDIQRIAEVLCLLEPGVQRMIKEVEETLKTP